MKLERILSLILIFVAVAGFSRGWFAMSSDRDQTGGKFNIHLSVDLVKVTHDTDVLRTKTRDFVNGVLERDRSVSIDEPRLSPVNLLKAESP